VPLAGLPIVIGRTYDSLERSQDGDFGNGWKLSIGNPKLEVNPAGDVTLTMLDGRRVKFGFTPTSPGGALGFLLVPTYTGEPGAYGTLSASAGGCGLVSPSGGGYVCFPGYWYKPTQYQYRDPYGRLYEIAAPSVNGSISTPGKLVSITDLNGNKLTYDPSGIKVTGNQAIPNNAGCPVGYLVCFDRVNNRITKITDTTGITYTYNYASTGGANYTSGDLVTVTLPVLTTPITYTYFTATTTLQHLFKEAFDPRGNQQVVTDYDANGRLISVAQPVNASTRYTTTYAYTLPTTTNPNSSTTITNPDVGGQHQIVVQSFDGYGKLISETMDVGIDPNTSQMVRRSTQNSYDTSHNITQTLLPKISDGTPDIGRAVNYEFNAQGYQTAVTNTVSIPTRTNYNPYGGPQSIIEPFGSGGTHTWGVGYDANFLPTSVTDTIGTAGGYAFDSRGSVLSRSDGNGKSSLYTYDQYGNKVSETDPLGNLNRYQYDTMGRMIQMTDAVGVVTQYQYDNIGRVITVTNAFGGGVNFEAKTSYTYDNNGNKLTEKDARGNIITYTYDFANRVTVITNPNGTSQSFVYDWRGNRTQENSNTSGGSPVLTTTYGYDLAGQLITTTSASGSTTDAATTVNVYDAAGRKTRQYNAYSGSGSLPLNQPYILYEYDNADRVITLTNQVTKTTSTTYDDAGRTYKLKDANGRVMTYTYDIRGRSTQTDFVDGTNNKQAYDGAGNVISKTDQAGKITSYSYDELNRLKAVNIPINVSGGVTQTTSYQYDVLGRLKTILDANQHSTKFEYDLLGRQSKKIWPDNSFEVYGYDLVGNRTSQQLTAPAGTSSGLITNTYQYDNMNRLSQLNYGDNSRVITMSYTATGQRQTITDSLRSGTTQYSYDKRDRVTSITQPGSQVLKVQYQWDASSNRTTMTATAGSTPKVTSYTYDNALRLSTVKGADDGANQTAYTYDPVGLRTKMTLPNGITVSYEYDSLNRLKTITDTQGSSNVLARYSYTLGAAGNRTKVTEYDNTSTEWSYDDSYRLSSEVMKNSGGTVLTTTNYTYDKTGNRLSYATTGSSTVNYLYNELDQLLSEGSKLYSYDKRGNLSGVSGGTYYTWDVMDRLIGASVPGGSISYLYDHDGRRVKQTIGANVTNFLWDAQSAYGDVALETDGSNAIQNSYVLGNGELLSQKRSSANAEYFLYDGHSGVRNLTSNTGSVLENYKYDAFGNLQGFSGTPNTKYLYTGQQFDSLTGLYDLRARYYNPNQARFLARDVADVTFNNPIELNRYGYTADNPVNHSDPEGLSFVDLSFIKKIAIAARPALGAVGKKLVDVAIELVSDFLIGQAQNLYEDLLSHLGSDKKLPLSLVYGEGTDKFGYPQKFMTISDYNNKNFGNAYEGKINDFKNYYQNLGWIVDGGEYRPGVPGNNLKHAEDYMEDVAKGWKNRQPGTNIVSATGNPRGICNQCKSKPGRRPSKTGIVIDLAIDGLLFIAGLF